MTLLHIALYEPEIPPNTGNIARLCAANDLALHIIGKAKFDMDDKAVKRAGLDYWPHVNISHHADLPTFQLAFLGMRIICLTTKTKRPYTDVVFQPGDCLMFGPETRGLPAEVLLQFAETTVTIPMTNPYIRSLNLATSVGVVTYEALRQLRG